MKRSHRRMAGFTLIEIMIVVVIIAVLAAVAYPSYNNHVTKTRRAAAAACLLENAQLMERFFTTNLTYTGATLNQCGNGLATHYQVSFVGGAPQTRSYTLQAVPQGQQASRDTKCATLQVTSQGVRSVTGTSSSTPANCW